MSTRVTPRRSVALPCPLSAIVATFELDERTVADWQFRAGQHARQVHSQLIGQGQVELGQVQADELYTKTQAGPLWVAMAMSVFSRLWLGGALNWKREAALLEPVLEQVRAAAQPQQPILFAVDGLSAYVKCILKVFRDPLHTGKRGDRG